MMRWDAYYEAAKDTGSMQQDEATQAIHAAEQLEIEAAIDAEETELLSAKKAELSRRHFHH